MKQIYSSKLILMLLVQLSFVASNSFGQAANLDQYRNGSASSPNVTGSNWVNGNAGASNSHYVEGMSVPYRCVMTGLPTATPITITFGYDITHSSKDAIDYLTYYRRLSPHTVFGHLAEPIDPTAGTPLFGNPGTTFPIPVPSAINTPVAGQPTTSFNALPAGERVMTIYGGTITAIVYNTEGDLSLSQSETTIDVTFTATGSEAILSWGGHIGSRLDWGFVGGVPRSAGGISGSPYHMRLKDWTLGNLGNEDRSLSASAVIGPPTCAVAISPASQEVCQGDNLTITVNTATGQSPFTYVWIGPNNFYDSLTSVSSTEIVSINNAQFVNQGIYTLVITDANAQSCTANANINVDVMPICSFTQNTSNSCPGSTNTFTCPAVLPTYNWVVQGNGTISGPNDQQTVTVISGGNCSDSYTLYLTLTNGVCTSTCSQLVQNLDNTNPVITCPADVLNLQCGDASDPGHTGSATATDNCTASPGISHSDAAVAGCAHAGIDRTWTATDACGNQASCVQHIRFVDTTPPVITCPADVLNLQCGDASDPGHTGSATATDNCADSPVISHSDAAVSGCAHAGIDRTWTATDACGNQASCVQHIRFVDTTPPVITCPADVLNLQCGASTNPNNTGSATATDNCNGSPVITHSDAAVSGCAHAGIDRTWTATDACGNQASCVQHIRFIDTTPPVITCPANANLQCGQPSDTAHTGSATATDNCSGNPVITHSDAPVTASCTGVAGIDRTWTATDACGNHSSCVQQIRYVDTTPPQISCPADYTMQGDAGSGRPCEDIGGGGAATYVSNIPSRAKSPTPCDFRQPRNQNHPSSPLKWTNGSNNLAQSEYFEGMGIPQRIIFTGVSPVQTGNTHALIFRHEAVKHQSGDRHAFDFLMSWEQAVATAGNIGGNSTNELQDLLAQACYTGISSAAYSACTSYTSTAFANIPDTMGNPPNHHGIANVNSVINCFESIYGDRNIEIDGNAPITSCSLAFSGYSGSATGDNYAWYTLTWTSTSSNIMIKMAGRAAVGFGVCGYGACFGAGQINGAPYHFKLEYLDGKSLGNRDNQSMVNVLDCNLGIPVTFGNPTATDNCTANPAINMITSDSVTYIASNAVQHCRTWSATDACGNSSQCSQCITIECPITSIGSNGNRGLAPQENVEGVTFNAYPNPFKSTVTIEFSSDISTHSLVEVYTMEGSKVATLFNENTEAGVAYKSEFDAKGLADGIYVYRIINGDHIINGKLTLIR
jgi:hypothetical protein